MPPRNRISLEQRERIVRAFEDVHEDYLAIAETIGVNRSTARSCHFKHYRGILVTSLSPNVDSGSGLCRRTYQDASITKKETILKFCCPLLFVIITQMFNDSRDRM